MFSKFFLKNILFCFVLFFSSLIFSQDAVKQAAAKKTYEMLEENFVVLLENRNLVLIYFYDPVYPDSIKMKSIVEKSLIEGNPDIFTVNIATNLGLRKTFNVQELPALVVLKNRKLIYGISGYVDDSKVLADYINVGIKNGTYE